MIALIAALVLQAPPVEEPAWTGRADTGRSVTADCVAANIRGKRLGLNPLTLRPSLLRLGSSEIIEVGPGIKFVVEDEGAGSVVRLYSRAWIPRLASFVRPCVAP